MYKIILLAFCGIIINSISLQVDENLVCFYFHQEHQNTFFKFEVNAEKHPDKIAINVLTMDGQLIQSFQQKSGQTRINGTEMFKICMQSTDKKTRVKRVTFDVWEQTEHKYRAIANKYDYTEIHRGIVHTTLKLQDVERSESFHAERQTFHSQLISSTQTSIRKYEILKMILMLLLGIGQIAFIKALLKDKKQQSI